MVTKRLLIVIVLALVVTSIATLSSLLYGQGHPVQGEAGRLQHNYTLPELADNMRPIYPTITIVNGSLNNNVNGTHLIQQADSSQSRYAFQDQVGYLRSVSRDGLAQMIMYRGITSDGRDIVAITLANIGSTKLYVKSLGINGETSTGMVPLEAQIIDSDYSVQVHGQTPAPIVTRLVTLYPGQSISAYIQGGPWFESYTNQYITNFSAGSSFFYEIGDPNYNNGTIWSIGVNSNQLIFGAYSNSTST